MGHNNQSHAVDHGIQDVDKARLLEELAELRVLKAEYNALFETSFDGIVLSDGDGATLKINKEYVRITNVKPEEILGRTMRELLNKGVLDRVATWKELKKGKPVTVHQKLYTGKSMLVTSTPVFDPNTNKIVRVISNCRDLTELNKLQEQLKKSAAENKLVMDEISRLRAEKLAEAEVISRSVEMERIVSMALRIAEFDTTTLITGESGSGKDVIAKLIHKSSPRKSGPFVKINCGAIPENLIESELFGYEKGAFTGASQEGKAGVFEMASSGTLFMDEIGELSPRMAVGLLNVLQDKKITRVGSSKAVKIDTRVIAATNADLAKLVDLGKFRSDLFFRLNVININIPPLRDRPDDIQALCLQFLKEFNKLYRKEIKIDHQALGKLTSYYWPGNVRELRNLVERLVIMSDNNVITLNNIPISQPRTSPKKIEPTPPPKIDEIEKLYDKYRSTRKVAAILRCHQSTIVRRLNKYGIMDKYK